MNQNVQNIIERNTIVTKRQDKKLKRAIVSNKDKDVPLPERNTDDIYETEIVIPIDSRPPFRDVRKYPNPNHFSVTLPVILQQVTYVELASMELPNTEPVIRSYGARQNNIYRFVTQDAMLYSQVNTLSSSSIGTLLNVTFPFTSSPSVTGTVIRFFIHIPFAVGDVIILQENTDGNFSTNILNNQVYQVPLTLVTVTTTYFEVDVGISDTVASVPLEGNMQIDLFDPVENVILPFFNREISLGTTHFDVVLNGQVVEAPNVITIEVPSGSYALNELSDIMESLIQQTPRNDDKPDSNTFLFQTIDSAGTTEKTTIRNYDTFTLSNNPIQAQQNTGILVVTQINHPFGPGDTITIFGATKVAGVVASLINTDHVILDTTGTTFTIEVNALANSSISGGGNDVIVGELTPFQLRWGLPDTNTMADTLGFYNEHSSIQLPNDPFLPIIYNIDSVDWTGQVLEIELNNINDTFWQLSPETIKTVSSVLGTQVTFTANHLFDPQFIDEILTFYDPNTNATYMYPYTDITVVDPTTLDIGFLDPVVSTGFIAIYRYPMHSLQSGDTYIITSATVVSDVNNTLVVEFQVNLPIERLKTNDILVNYKGRFYNFAATRRQDIYTISIVKSHYKDFTVSLFVGKVLIDGGDRVCFSNFLSIPIYKSTDVFPVIQITSTSFQVYMPSLGSFINPPNTVRTSLLKVQHPNHGMNEIITAAPWPMDNSAIAPIYGTTNRFSSPYTALRLTVPLPDTNQFDGGFGLCQYYYISDTELDVLFLNNYLIDTSTFRVGNSVLLLDVFNRPFTRANIVGFLNYNGFAPFIQDEMKTYAFPADPITYLGNNMSFVIRVQVLEQIPFPFDVAPIDPTIDNWFWQDAFAGTGPGTTFENYGTFAGALPIIEPVTGHYGIPGYLHTGTPLRVSGNNLSDVYTSAQLNPDATRLFPPFITSVNTTLYTRGPTFETNDALFIYKGGYLGRSLEVMFYNVFGVADDVILSGIALQRFDYTFQARPISKDMYIIDAHNMFSNDTPTWGGGDAVRMSSDTHGFAKTQSNTIDYTQDASIVSLPKLDGEPYIYLQSPELDTVLPATRTNELYFAKLRLTQAPQFVVYDDFVTSPKIFNTPLDALSVLTFRLRTACGDYYELNGHNYSFTLRVRYLQSALQNTQISSAQNLANINAPKLSQIRSIRKAP